MDYKDRLFLGDCLDVLPTLPDNSIDLVVTSATVCRQPQSNLRWRAS